jgi:hypothetical protein
MNTRYAAIAAFTAMSIMPASAQDLPPNIVATWTGTFTGGVRTGGGQLANANETATYVNPGDNVYTLTITEQEGRGFKGTWGTGLGSEEMQGVIRLDNRTILTVDVDSTQIGTLLSENELEFCNHTVNITDRFSFCFLLRKQ